MRHLFILLFVVPMLVNAQKKKITLEDIYKNYTFRGESVGGFDDEESGKILSDENKSLLKQKNINTSDNSISPAKDKILFFDQREHIYRRSSKAYTYLFDLSTKSVKKIDTAKILHATFSPDGSRIAYVKNNNLYIYSIAEDKSKAVTTDGRWNYVINGNCDWVYEEEFSFSRAFEWSPNGKYLAYYRFDESKVKEYNMTVYNDYYNADYRYKYPKAGEDNSKVEIHILNTETGQNILARYDTGDIYIPRIQWIPAQEQLVVFWLNRHQDDLKLLNTNPATGAASILYEEKNKYYVDIDNERFDFLKDGKQLLYSSEKNGFWHLYLRSIGTGKEVQLSKGSFDVADINGIDEKNKKVYYTAAYPRPMDRTAFVVDFGGSKNIALTNDMAWHNVTFNSDFTKMYDSRSDINTPPSVTLYDVQNGIALKNPVVKGSNEALKNKLAEYDIAKASFIQVPNGKGEMLNGYILKPSNFDPARKYPVLFCNYGGPGSQTVANRYGVTSYWHQYLAERGFIIVGFDNTGTGFRGEEFKKKTYLQLGKYEIEDQIAAAKWLATQSYVDATRIGHWGWSFGGFMSALAISKGSDIFSFAISVAPVTSWRFYDNIYTERYMRTPQENKASYDENAPLHYVNNIKGKYLLIHGTGDDNVHFQNSVELAEAMIQANVPFDCAYYPNKNHGISGGNTTYHLWTRMSNWLIQNVLEN